MRQIFTSARLETVEGVARLLNDAGIETWISEARSYKGTRRRTFSYRERAAGDSQPGVWIVRADDLTRARELLREAGLLESTRGDSFLPPLTGPTPGNDPERKAHRVRLVLLALLAMATLLTLARACSTPREAPVDPSHIVPVYTSPP